MSKKEIVIGGLTIPVKTVVNDTYEIYDMKPKLLKNDFYVSAEFISKDVYNEVEALQEAQIYQDNRWMSRKAIMEKKLKMQDVPAQLEEMDEDEVEAAIPEFKLRKMIKRKQGRYDRLMEQGIEDKDLADQIKMLKEQLGMLIAQKQQAVQPPPPGAEGAPSPQRQPPPARPQGAPR